MTDDAYNAFATIYVANLNNTKEKISKLSKIVSSLYSVNNEYYIKNFDCDDIEYQITLYDEYGDESDRYLVNPFDL